MSENERYTIQELSDLTGVSRRTIRLWTHRRIIPNALSYGSANKCKHYDDRHVRAIKHVLSIKGQTIRMTDIPKLTYQPT